MSWVDFKTKEIDFISALINKLKQHGWVLDEVFYRGASSQSLVSEEYRDSFTEVGIAKHWILRNVSGHKLGIAEAFLFETSALLVVPPEGSSYKISEKGLGSGSYTEHHHDLGKTPKTVSIYYDMYGYPDKMDVFYNGKLVASTNDYVPFSGVLTFEYNPVNDMTEIVIIVSSDTEFTAWEYGIDWEEGVSPPPPPPLGEEDLLCYNFIKSCYNPIKRVVGSPVWWFYMCDESINSINTVDDEPITDTYIKVSDMGNQIVDNNTLYNAVLRAILDTEVGGNLVHYRQVNQSPIVPLVFRDAKLVNCFNQEYDVAFDGDNWWSDTMVSIKGNIEDDNFFLVVNSDKVPVMENPHHVSSIPLFFGEFIVPFSKEEGVWKDWSGNVALFSGLSTVAEEPSGDISLYVEDTLADKDVDGNSPMTLIRVTTPSHFSAYSPLKRDYASDPSIGNGIQDIIVRKNVFNEYYKSHVFSWNTPANSIAPIQLEDTFSYDKGLEFEKVGGRPDKKAYAYQFNPSRYGDFIQGSLARIVSPYGVYGWLPNVLFTSPMSLIDGDVVSVVNPKICGDEVDYNFSFISCPYSPLTYPFWIDPYPCIEVPPVKVGSLPKLPLPTPSTKVNYPALKVVVRWEGPSPFLLEGSMYLNHDHGKRCDYMSNTLYEGESSVVYYTPYNNHAKSEDFHNRPCEFWVGGKEGTTMSLFITNFSIRVFNRSYRNTLKTPVCVDIVQDTHGYPHWLDDRNYNNEDCILIKRYEIPPSLLSGVPRTHSFDNTVLWVCDLIWDADGVNIVDVMKQGTKENSYEASKMLAEGGVGG